MITTSADVRDLPSWQQELARAVTDPAELMALLDLDTRALPIGAEAAAAFALRVPRSFIARMRRGDPHDPLLRQVLPLEAESSYVPGFGLDPVGDRAAAKAPGLLHKYRGRVLINTTAACAIHCRYCFRRHFPYAEVGHGRSTWEAIVGYVRADDTIREVILSGGDPLSLHDHRLAQLVERLESVRHLRRLRIHTRLPVVLPERVDAGLLAWLGGTRLAPVMVIHANHPNEIDPAVRAALGALEATGITLLNQSVLLRGINDSAEILAHLSEILFAAGVLPYYLHLLDRVQGAAHFEVETATAMALHEALSRDLPGYLVPRLVREVAGAPYKLRAAGSPP
jgi:EF-P beta-lysylation protein EpmB